MNINKGKDEDSDKNLEETISDEITEDFLIKWTKNKK